MMRRIGTRPFRFRWSKMKKPRTTQERAIRDCNDAARRFKAKAERLTAAMESGKLSHTQFLKQLEPEIQALRKAKRKLSWALNAWV